MNKIIAMMLFMCALIGQVFAADASASDDWVKEKIADMVPVNGSYRNEQYGFGVSVLQTRAYQPTGRDPDHGIIIVLGDGRTITVSAMYDAAFYGSTKSQLNHRLQGEHFDSVKRSAAVLDGKPAAQAVLQKGKNITKVVVQRRNAEEILYSAELTTNKDYQNEDLKTFDNIIHTFKTYSIPK
ncbi:MAG: hypothetical protein P4L91_16360 [Burkholderiaceae bacterium]|nr:hypothetical protein [Burkholderiaceae bacterium]